MAMETTLHQSSWLKTPQQEQLQEIWSGPSGCAYLGGLEIHNPRGWTAMPRGSTPWTLSSRTSSTGIKVRHCQRHRAQQLAIGSHLGPAPLH
eukprot:SAG31_NODE_10619_length_1116_cov_1.489676_1_plen_91_part_10